ncbi:MAG: catechol 2,3-dioxygenase-like lactoylglutathione lyase family enzyme [Limisphaerales bacterium]|jgi:catechol 2,3-dioxygenase-like lactoylglutathione lyase family enzyme
MRETTLSILLSALLLTGCAAENIADTDGSALTLSAPPIADLAGNDIGLLARIHFATHTADFDRARAFYRELGYTEGITGFPLTNTHQMARALGMFDICQYELAKGEVMALPGSPNPASIDLLQFKTPFNDAPPYEFPNHLGMAYAVYATSDFDADTAHLKELDTEFLAQPYGSRGERFVFFRDPDGVLYKLSETLESDAEHADAGIAQTAMNIFDMPYIAINVSDLDASLAFYAQFGYQPLAAPALQDGSLEEGQAYGLDQPIKVRSVDIAISRGDNHRLRLSQWLAPFDDKPAYPAPINHIGLNRVAVLVADLDRAVDILKSQNVPFLSELAPCCSGTGDDKTAIVHAIDPDGVFIELVGGIAPRPALPQPEACPPLEIKYPPAPR